MSPTTYPTPSPTPERRPIKSLHPTGSANKKQLFGSSPSPIPDNIFSINVNSSFVKKSPSSPTTPPRDNVGSFNFQFPTSPSENKSLGPGKVSFPSLSPKSPIFSNLISNSSPNFFKRSPSPQSTTDLFGDASSQSSAEIFDPSPPPAIVLNNVVSGSSKKELGFQPGTGFKGLPSPQSATVLFGGNSRSPIPQPSASPSTNKSSQPKKVFNQSLSSSPTIFSNNVTSGPFKKQPSFQNNVGTQFVSGSPTNKSSQPVHVFKGLSSPQPTTGLFGENLRSPTPQPAPIRNKGSETRKVYNMSPSLRMPSQQPAIDQAARPLSSTGWTTASTIFSCSTDSAASIIRPGLSSAGGAERESGQQRTRYIKISPPTTLQLPDEESQKILVAEFAMRLDKLTEDQAFEDLANLSESISSIRLDVVKRLVESQFDCLMDWTWTIATVNKDPPPVIINGSATDNDPLLINGPASLSICSPAVNNHLPLSKRFFPRFGTPGSSRIDIGTRFQGWCQRSPKGGNILRIQYGLEENFLCEVVPGAEVGNLVLSKLENLETQETQRIDSWDDGMRITNVAISRSTKQPRIWVCINNSAWVTRSDLIKLRIENGTRPLGKQSAKDCIMQCVEEKADWYRAVGYAEEADRYKNQFSFL